MVEYSQPTHFYYFTRKSLEAVLKRAGFSETSELRISLRYPGHRIIRRIVHHALVSCRLEGQLVFIARRGRSKLLKTDAAFRKTGKAKFLRRNEAESTDGSASRVAARASFLKMTPRK